MVSLYAVYESAVTEVARLIQSGQEQPFSIDDIKGNDFLDRARKYYKHILKIDLCTDIKAWNRLSVLSKLRNAIAHTNGRLEMLKGSAKKQISEIAQRHIGIQEIQGYLVFDRHFVRDTYLLVQTALEGLVQRYKEWDTAARAMKNEPEGTKPT